MEFDYDCLPNGKEVCSLSHILADTRPISLPSDFLTPEAMERRNGPCRVYRLGKPMSAAELEAMPQDLQRTYLQRLRSRGGSDEAVGRMLGLSPARLRQLTHRHRVRFDQPDREAWAAFLRS